MSSIIRGVIYGDGDLSELVEGVLVEAIANGDATRLAHSREERAVKRCGILTRRRLAGKVDITGRFREFDVILTGRRRRARTVRTVRVLVLMPRRDASRDGIGHFDSVFLVRTSQVPDEIFDDVGFIEFFDLDRGVPGAQRDKELWSRLYE